MFSSIGDLRLLSILTRSMAETGEGVSIASTAGIRWLIGSCTMLTVSTNVSTNRAVSFWMLLSSFSNDSSSSSIFLLSCVLSKRCRKAQETLALPQLPHVRVRAPCTCRPPRSLVWSVLRLENTSVSGGGRVLSFPPSPPKLYYCLLFGSLPNYTLLPNVQESASGSEI